ncbi:hypothetical protein F4779DRAFT_622296 [Xylariaceae sp. FL0662B]|nr:hypothetical protein F4779DRAFT_622296 [Xylariaceae sp. FL0662B]
MASLSMISYSAGRAIIINDVVIINGNNRIIALADNDDNENGVPWICGTCWSLFNTPEARQRHLDAVGHAAPAHECQTCPRFFASQCAVERHMREADHWSLDCWFCGETWPTEEQLREHEVAAHCYCIDCDRLFANDEDFWMHMNSNSNTYGGGGGGFRIDDRSYEQNEARPTDRPFAFPA